MKFSIIVSLFLANLCLFAHEGHDKVPGANQGLYGGVVAGNSRYFLELVNESGNIKIFPMTHEKKTVDPKSLKIKIKAINPQKKPLPASVVEGKDHFVVKVVAQGSYRYTIIVDIDGGPITFQVEP